MLEKTPKSAFNNPGKEDNVVFKCSFNQMQTSPVSVMSTVRIMLALAVKVSAKFITK